MRNLIAAVEAVDPLVVTGKVAGVSGLLIEARGGLSRLAVEATVGVTDLVEAMHHGIARPWSSSRGTAPARTRGLTGWIYRSIRWVTRRVGRGVSGMRR